MQTLVLTGGGTAGHVMPNLALIPRLRELGWGVEYIGETGGMEQDLAERAGLPFHGIPAGKLRRYFDWKNFSDPLRVLAGLWKCWWLLRRLRPAVVFSKGGFVAVPVVWAARLRRIPVIIHESDLSPGLANRLCLPAATRVCVSFPDTLQHLSPKAKARATGLPIREELLQGNAESGRAFLGLEDDKPMLLVMGGSLGSRALNIAVRGALPQLLPHYHVAHLCGKGHLDPALANLSGYAQREFVHGELPDVMAAAAMAVSRAGANAVFELLALRLPHLLIPLSLKASRGDQLQNAAVFARLGYSRVLEEERLTAESLLGELELLDREAAQRRDVMAKSPLGNGLLAVLSAIQEFG